MPIAFSIRRNATGDEKDKRIKYLEESGRIETSYILDVDAKIRNLTARAKNFESDRTKLREQLNESNTQLDSCSVLLRDVQADLEGCQSRVVELEGQVGELEMTQPRCAQSIDEVTTLLVTSGGTLRLHAKGAGGVGEGGNIYWEVANFSNLVTERGDRTSAAYSFSRYCSSIFGHILSGVAELTFPEVTVRPIVWDRCRQIFAAELLAWTNRRGDSLTKTWTGGHPPPLQPLYRNNRHQNPPQSSSSRYVF
jgi:hypothetical protein